MSSENFKRILYLGSVFSDEALESSLATNQASHRWSLGFLTGLSRHNCDVTCVSVRSARLWPKENLYRVGREQDFSDAFKVVPVSYFNVPFLRAVSLKVSYRRSVKKLLKREKYDMIFCYNLYKWHVGTFSIIKKYNNNALIIPIILDEDDPRADNWSAFKRRTLCADYLVFLSYWGYVNNPVKLPCYQLDSATEEWNGEWTKEKRKIPTIVYAGKYSETYGGLAVLSEILNKLSAKYKVKLAGKAKEEVIKKYFGDNPNIEYCGFLSEMELHKLHLEADVFLNYRPTNVTDNLMIFPSKLTHYLSYGKPVVSSRTQGIPPEYDKFLSYPCEETVEDYIKVVEKELSRSPLELQKFYVSCQKWFLDNKIWSKVCGDLLSFIYK